MNSIDILIYRIFMVFEEGLPKSFLKDFQLLCIAISLIHLSLSVLPIAIIGHAVAGFNSNNFLI